MDEQVGSIPETELSVLMCDGDVDEQEHDTSFYYCEEDEDDNTQDRNSAL